MDKLMRNLSWRVKLLVLFTLVLGASLLFQLFYVLPTIRNWEAELAQVHQEEIARNIARELDTDLLQIKNILTRIAERTEFRNMDIADQQTTMVQHTEISLRVSSLSVMDAEGWFVSSTMDDLSMHTGESYADRLYFTVPFEQGQVYFAAPRFYSQAGIVGTSVGVPIESETGERVGVLIGGMRLNELVENVTDYPLEEEQVAFLVDREGTVIAHSGVDLFALEEGPLSLDYSDRPLVQAIMDGDMGRAGEHDYEGEPYFGTYAILESNGWGVVVETPMHTILARSEALAGQLLAANTALFGAALAVSLVFTQQITAKREQAEKALRESEERFRTVADFTHDWEYWVGTDGNHLYVSPSCERITGYRTGEFLQDPELLTAIIHPDDRAMFVNHHHEVLETGGVLLIDFRIITRSGDERWIGHVCQPVYSSDGRRLGLRGSNRDITERKQAEERIAHLNAVLRAIRNVNQLITREKDRDRLLQGACESLIETRGYHNAWIALLDEDGKVMTTVEAGLGEDFSALVEQLKRGELTACGRNALAQQDVVVVKDPLSTCTNCPLAAKCGGRGAMTVRLQHGGKVYGLLAVSVTAGFVADEEEHSLLKEIAGDIALALHTIGLEEGRKRAEEALRISEAVLDAFFRESPVGMNLIDDQLRYVRVNRLAQERILLSLEEIVGKPIHEVVPEFAGEIVPGLRRVLETGQPELGIEVSGELPSKPGVTTHWLSYHFPITMPDGRIWGIGVIANDITERKRAEEALRESEEKYRTILENIEDGYFEVDIAGNFTFFNDSLCKLLGYPKDELMGMNNRGYMDDEDARKVYQTFNTIYRTGKPAEAFDWEVIRKDGTKRFVEASVSLIRDPTGEPVGFRGVVRDITERKRAEEALKEYSERLEEMVEERTAQLQAQYTHLDAILRSTTDGIIVTDRQGEIIQANPVANTWLTKTLSPEDAGLLQEAVQSIARQACAEETGFSGKNPVSLLELTGLDLELRAAPISEPGVEEAAAAVVAIHDISELKALDRMKSRFVTNVSHELRTPVTTIKLYAYLMRRKPEKREQYLDTLAQEADHLAGLVEGILQISRIDAGRLDMNPQPTPLNELTEMAIISHQALAQERGLTLEHHPAEPGPLALVDPEPLMQVLNNLVENGIYYTPEGGKVLVSTGKEEAEGRVWATMTVADTGMGIPEEELPHTFERFFRGEKPWLMQISGTGLGLAIVKEIVELHGGRVTVESQVDVGATFTVWLPLAG